MKFIQCDPIYDYTIWANDALAKIRHRKWQHEGTSWEISAHPDRDCCLKDSDEKLSVYLETHPEALGLKYNLAKMVRVAWIDAKEFLSIQIHPGEDYAQKHSQDHEKSECWYIQEAAPDAYIIAGCHFNNKDEVVDALEKDEMEKYLHRIPVDKGDFIFVPYGTVHALGANILALEIGTNSNTTYRFYDFHRKDENGNERKLHIQESLDVMELDYIPEKIHIPLDETEKEIVLCDLDCFKVTLYDVEDNRTICFNKDSFHTISNLGNDVTITCGDEELVLPYTESVLLPAEVKEIRVSGSTRIIISEPH